MPPPATIYGHLCSALGEWVDPEGIEFAYRFTYDKAFDDVEHVHVLGAATGVLKGATEEEKPARGALPEGARSPRAKKKGAGIPKVAEGVINPFKRTILFRPQLVLYVNRPEWEAAFRSPRYVVVLGRSQDLFTYARVAVIDLVRAESAYLEHTLAPYRVGIRAGRGYAVTMPRFLDYTSNRAPTFARYVVLNRRVHSRDLLRFEEDGEEQGYWVDPEWPRQAGDGLGILFHSFVGEYNDAPYMA